LFEKSVSWQQLTKNLAVNGASVVGGAAGWLGGAATGASIGSLVPVIGTGVGGVIGGLVGALGGGVALSATTKLAAERIVEDDSKRIMDMLRSELQIVAFEYLLTELEFESVMQVVSNSVTAAWIRSSFALVQSESSEENFRLMVRDQFEPICGEKIAERTRIELPTEEELLTELQNLASELTHADI
jgi:S-methylmethionine-dependent homocysteine/selenocysteine methylase